MRVKFLHSIASADWAYALGEIAEIEAELAEKWIASGICKPLPPAAEKPAKTKSK